MYSRYSDTPPTGSQQEMVYIPGEITEEAEEGRVARHDRSEGRLLLGVMAADAFEREIEAVADLRMYSPGLVDRSMPFPIRVKQGREDGERTHQQPKSFHEPFWPTPVRVRMGHGVARQPELTQLRLMVKLGVQLEYRPVGRGLLHKSWW